MAVAAGTLFFLSLAGIVALFQLKYLEESGRYALPASLKAALDRGALRMKALLWETQAEWNTLPRRALFMLRTFLHLAALALARSARFTERQAHRLADLVSHKRGFEKRETRSEFLRQVTEHKNSTDFDARG